MRYRLRKFEVCYTELWLKMFVGIWTKLNVGSLKYVSNGKDATTVSARG
jgi:hypothetical protein